jgi:hypothetical protein
MDGMYDKRRMISLLILGLCIVCVIGIILETQFQVIRRAYDRFILDNRNHYLSCQDLPEKSKVEKVVEQHQDVLQKIRQVAPGSVGVEIDSSTCKGKADLLIWYGTHAQRIAIEKILSEDKFFGIPYRLQNR